jgi:hypothetical protein
MFRRIISRLGEDTVIIGIFCWQEHLISSVWIYTLLSWEKMELKGEFRREGETWPWSYHKIRVGQSLLLHGSEYVHLRTIVYIPTFTYLFLLPKSHFLPLNHTQCLSFYPLLTFLLSVHCTSNHHSHGRANKSFGKYQNCVYVLHSSNSVKSPYHEPE